MGHKDDGLRWIFLDIGEKCITLPLKRLIANSKYFIKNQNVSLSLDSYRKSKSDLHT